MVVLIEKMILGQSSEGAEGVSCTAVCGKSIQAEESNSANALRCILVKFKEWGGGLCGQSKQGDLREEK